jgi:hypothetical protein
VTLSEAASKLARMSQLFGLTYGAMRRAQAGRSDLLTDLVSASRASTPPSSPASSPQTPAPTSAAGVAQGDAPTYGPGYKVRLTEEQTLRLMGLG